MRNIKFPEPDPQKGELLVVVNPRLFSPEQIALLTKLAIRIHKKNLRCNPAPTAPSLVLRPHG
jgi:hypothetical protein